MSDAIVSYKYKNKFERYHLLTTTEQATYDDLVTNFIKELITEVGSCVFDKDYGTNFYEYLGNVANIYRVRDAINKATDEIKDKYGIVAVDVSDVHFSSADGFMNISLKIFFKDVALVSYLNAVYNGSYTDKDIIEIG